MSAFRQASDDTGYICDQCGTRLLIDPHSPSPMEDARVHGWHLAESLDDDDLCAVCLAAYREVGDPR